MSLEMVLTTILLPGLILMVLLIASYTVVRNWRLQQERSQKAAKRGWRYTPSGWSQLVKPQFQLAGSTQTGVIWELRRVWHNGQLKFYWQTHSAPLPYGTVGILPAQATTMPVIRPFKTYPIPKPTPSWPDVYQAFTSHDQLVNTFFNKKIAGLLQQYPPWPASGSLEKLIWKQKSLLIVCSYEEDWQVLERTVALGTTLIEMTKAANPVR